MKTPKILLFVVLLGFVLGLINFLPIKASGENWLSNYTFRKKIIIGNATGAGTNYQINVTVHNGTGTDSNYDIFTGNNCTDFPNDIQFADNDGDTALYQWSRAINTTAELFWFRVLDNLNSSNVDVYIYYSRSGQANTNDFIRTFIFGDPFDNTTLNTQIWSSVTGNPSYTIDATNHYLQVTNLDVGWSAGYGFHSNTTLVFPYSYIMQDAYGNTNGIYYYVDTTADNKEINKMGLSIAHNIIHGADYGISWSVLGDFWSASKNWAVQAGIGGNTDYNSGAGGAPPKTTYFEHIKPNGTIYINESGTNRVTEANTETPNRVHIWVARLVGYPFGTSRVGAFFIRKYVDPEPIIDSIGSVETSVHPPENISCIITNIETNNDTYVNTIYYIFQSIVNDTDNNIRNISIAFYDARQWSNFTFHLDTDTWTKDVTNNITHLDTASCTNSTSGNLVTANFYIFLNNSINPHNDTDIYMNSIDLTDSEDAWENINSDYFNIVYLAGAIELPLSFGVDVISFFTCLFIIALALIGRKNLIVGIASFILALIMLLPLHTTYALIYELEISTITIVFIVMIFNARDWWRGRENT